MILEFSVPSLGAVTTLGDVVVIEPKVCEMKYLVLVQMLLDKITICIETDATLISIYLYIQEKISPRDQQHFV